MFVTYSGIQHFYRNIYRNIRLHNVHGKYNHVHAFANHVYILQPKEKKCRVDYRVEKRRRTFALATFHNFTFTILHFTQFDFNFSFKLQRLRIIINKQFELKYKLKFEFKIRNLEF